MTRAFISYSAGDKKWASSVKSALKVAGFQGFLAHDDLLASEEWRASIMRELKKTELFIAILSKRFKRSDWCAQETGFIVSRPKVLVIPLSVDGTMPYGFLSHLQGVNVRSGDDVSRVILEVLLRKRPRIGIPAWIRAAAAAGSFRAAESVVEPMVPCFAKFTEEEAVAFAKAALGNYQVWDAFLCRTKYLPAFARANWKSLPRKLRREFLKKTEMSEDEL